MSTLSLEQIETLKSIDSPTVANAIEAFDVRDPTDGYASLQLRCMFPHLEPMVGYAVTCSVDTTSPLGGAPPRNLKVLYEAVADAPQPAVVVMQSLGPSRLRTLAAGDIVMTTVRRLGAVGLVTDGAVRDLKTVRECAPDFQVYACGNVVSHGTFRIVEVGVTVAICGMLVHPGDLLHGDENGLQTVPIEVVDGIPEEVERIRKREDGYRTFVTGEAFTLSELLRTFGE